MLAPIADVFPEHRKSIDADAAQDVSADLFDVILFALVESGLPPERLELELTESILISSLQSWTTSCSAADAVSLVFRAGSESFAPAPGVAGTLSELVIPLSYQSVPATSVRCCLPIQDAVGSARGIE